MCAAWGVQGVRTPQLGGAHLSVWGCAPLSLVVRTFQFGGARGCATPQLGGARGCAIYFCSGSYMDLSRKRIIFVTSTSCVFLLEQSSYLFCCTPLLPLTLGGAPPLHPLCTPYHRCCTPRLWRCTPLAPPRTLTGVGLWNITDVLEFPSTLTYLIIVTGTMGGARVKIFCQV